MRYLLAATALTPVIAGMVVTPLLAQTVISTPRTTPVLTSTINNGNAGDVRISSAGSVKPAGGAAVTIDSNNTVTNEGTIQFTGVNNATGILANPGTAGTIANSGKIILDENFTPTDSDKDGDLDGPFATGAGRTGIRIAPGGTFTGTIANSGQIEIEGNNSSGILIEGTLAGSLTNSGQVQVLGGNSYGIRAGDVTGNVRITNGSIEARGENAVGVALDGDISGAVSIQGSITSSGYRLIQSPPSTSKLDADDLLQGGSALRVTGNVAGGILFDAPPPNNSTTDDDEDDDGVKDAAEGTARVSSYGAAPAVRIGSASEDIVIGAVAGQSQGHGLVVKGHILGSGVYQGVAANGIVIGGLGGDVTVAGGMTVAGSISARSVGASAVAVHVGDGATVAEIRNSGDINASGGGTATARSHAILIDDAGSVGSIRNSGKITAALNAVTGTASAITDRSGDLTLIENSGEISATGAAPATGRVIAIDALANSSGVTVRQLVAGQGQSAPSITGNILLGSGDDLLDIRDGRVTGNTSFGAGDDSLSLSGDAVYTGDVNFGAGTGTLVLAGTAAFNGALSSSGSVAVNVAGGSLNLTNSGTVALSSLTLGGNASMTVNINGAAGTSTLYDVAGTASFGTGSRLVVNLDSAQSVGNYVVLRAGDLVGGSNLVNTTVLPFLFASSLNADENANQVTLSIRRKTATELGLNRSEAGAYDAIYESLGNDEVIENFFLAIDDGDTLRSSFQQMLPDHAGGVFETVTQASRATMRHLSDPRPPVYEMGGWGFFLQQVAWGTSKDLGDTSAYDISGWGASGGIEVKAGNAGNVGLTASYLIGKNADGTTENQVRTNQYELGAHWRGDWNALGAFARASAAYLDLEGSRRFTASTGTSAITREAESQRNGTLLSAGGGLSYEIRSGRFTVRPVATLDYYMLKEDGYAETGGGDGFNLDVDSRDSDELAANGTVALGYDLSGTAADESFLRLEIEGGRRQILAGGLGATTARFDDGDDFTLLPDERASGWVGKLRLLGGNSSFRVGGELNAEEQQGHAAVAARVSLNAGF